MATIPISFRLVQFQPDARRYKTASPILEPADELLVVIDVPLKHEFIYNAEEIIQAQISSGDDGISVLMITPAGLAFIEDAFLARIERSEEEKQSDDEIKWEDDTEEWKKEK